MNRFPVGTEVALCSTHHAQGSVFPSDPTTPVVFHVRKPDGTATSLSAARRAAGEFVATLLLDLPGRWAIRSATATAAAEQVLFVETVMEA